MFFVLSKTLGLMLLPTNFLIGLGLIGAILLVTRFASLGRKLMVAARRVAGDMRVFAARKLLLYPLEQRFPPWDAARGAPDGIIVLGGPIDADLSAAHGVPVIARRGRPRRSPRRRWRIVIPNARLHLFRRQRELDLRTTRRKPTTRPRCSKASAFPNRA